MVAGAGGHAGRSPNRLMPMKPLGRAAQPFEVSRVYRETKRNAMKTYMMDNDSAGGGARVEGEGTTNGGLTTEQMAGMEPISSEENSANQEDSADRATDRIESNTLGGTSGTGAGPAIGDGEPADTDE